MTPSSPEASQDHVGSPGCCINLVVAQELERRTRYSAPWKLADNVRMGRRVPSQLILMRVPRRRFRLALFCTGIASRQNLHCRVQPTSQPVQTFALNRRWETGLSPHVRLLLRGRLGVEASQQPPRILVYFAALQRVDLLIVTTYRMP